MRFVEVFKAAYSLLTNEDIRRQGKAAIQAALVTLYATRMINDAGVQSPNAVFIGPGFRPYGSAAANTMTLTSGLALFYDSGEADTFAGQVKPLLIAGNLPVTMPTNADASGHPRIDTVAIRAVTVQGDIRDASFKTPGTAAGTGIYTQSTPHEQAWAVEHQVFEGTPAAIPAAPALASGWLRVADVTRPNGQADVNPGDVADMRVLDVLRAGDLMALNPQATVLLGSQAASLFAGFKYINAAVGALKAGELVVVDNGHDGLNPDGPLVASEMKANNTPLALVSFGDMDFVGGTIADGTNLPSQNFVGPIASVKWRTGQTRTRPINGGGTDNYTGLSFVEIKLSEPLANINAVVHVHHTWRLPTEPLVLSAQVTDTSTIEIMCTQLDSVAGAGGSEVDTLTNLPDGRFMVTIYDLDRYA